MKETIFLRVLARSLIKFSRGKKTREKKALREAALKCLSNQLCSFLFLQMGILVNDFFDRRAIPFAVARGRVVVVV